jgi:hypothetical protein
MTRGTLWFVGRERERAHTVVCVVCVCGVCVCLFVCVCVPVAIWAQACLEPRAVRTCVRFTMVVAWPLCRD